MKPDQPEPKKSPAPRKVFDVMRPGKAPASPTSRPVIAGHKVHESVSGVSGVGETRPLGKHKKIELAASAPATAEETPEKITVQSVDSPKAEPKPEVPKPEAVPVIDATPVLPEKPAKKEEPKPAAPVMPPASTPEASADDPMAVKLPSEGPMPPAPENEVSQDAAPAPVPSHEEIIVGHHGPIDAPGQALLLLGLIIVLALVALNILLDADILKIDGIPHTNFFKG